MNRWQIKKIIQLALEEDIPFEDITTSLLINENLKGEALFIAKEPLVICGIPVVEEVFNFIDPELQLHWFVKEGEEINKPGYLGKVKGKLNSILKGERIALNLFQHLSGIATYTRKVVRKISRYNAVLVDTRKTLPGLKLLQKYAVRIGGGKNHRFSLSDGILIKDNHIKALGGMDNLAKLLKSIKIPHYLKVEIEVKSLEELKILVKQEAPVDVVLLDNFQVEEVKKAVEFLKTQKKSIKIEVSGGINLDNIEEFAKAGVDYISSGALTHSVKAVDISLKII